MKSDDEASDGIRRSFLLTHKKFPFIMDELYVSTTIIVGTTLGKRITSLSV